MAIKRYISAQPKPFKYQGEIHQVTISQVVFNDDKESPKNFWTVQSEELGIEPKQIRMYLPAAMRKGGVRTSFTHEEVAALLAGDKIQVPDLVSNKGDKYNASFAFDPEGVPSMDNPRYKGMINFVSNDDTDEETETLDF